MSEIRFNDGIPKMGNPYKKIIYPEDLLEKKCGGCVRCEPRDYPVRGRERTEFMGYHCCMQPYDVDITPEDKACVHWWDKAAEEERDRQKAQAVARRREELWAVYAGRDPVKPPIIHDGYGTIPECPICGEMPYSTEQCHWCGQRFIQDEKIEEYNKPLVEPGKRINRGADMEYTVSKYNGHKNGKCPACGAMFVE